jgi:glycerol-3-phosphate cytidylyltransferase
MIEKIKKRYKIGYTSGVFDMFHVGHLNIIMKSKELCDFLIVGVTTDEMAQYKNKKPIIPLEERMRIVEAIKYVDQVIPQKTLHKFDVWEVYKFDVIFVGSDWKGTTKWNDLEIQFKKIGTDVIYFDYTPAISSTLLREKLEASKKIK